MSLLYAPTCFEHNVLIVRRSKLYYTASGIITPVGGCSVNGLRERIECQVTSASLRHSVQ